MRLLRFALLLLGGLAATPAAAYPWMIRHEYTDCATCHASPSGAGLLTPYGRAQQALLVAMPVPKKPVAAPAARAAPKAEGATAPGAPAPGGGKAEAAGKPEAAGEGEGEGEGEAEEVSPGLAYGTIPLPEWLDVGVSFRGGGFYLYGPPAPSLLLPVLMASDLRAQVRVGPVRANASIGFAPRGATLAAITDRRDNNVVSRNHWIGVDLLDQRMLVRAGRIEIPFGLRNPEHTSWVRAETRTDINSGQQHGLAVSWTMQDLRAELMGIAGNFQIAQPEFREHGYAGVAEYALARTATLGVSSQVLTSSSDVLTRQADTVRQSHGFFTRWAITKPVVLLAEVDVLLQKSAVSATELGAVSWFQADIEPIQGLHFMIAGETLHRPQIANLGGWVGVSWFFFRYGELRLDGAFRRIDVGNVVTPNITVVAQVHLSM